VANWISLKTRLEREIRMPESWELPEFWQFNEGLPSFDRAPVGIDHEREVVRMNVVAGSGTRGQSSELFTDDGRDACSQNLNGPQHLLMRERRDAHLERDAREAAENFV